MEFTLLWHALTGVMAAVLVARLLRHRGLTTRESGLGDRLVGSAMVGLLAGRLTSMLVQGVNPLTNIADILVVRGGVHTGAAALTAVVTLVWSSRRNLWPELDVAAPAALAGLAGWHAGCLFRGACLGTVSDLPWALAQPGSTITRHPVELYAAVLYLLAAAVGLWAIGRWRSGVLAGASLAAAATVRLATEPLLPSLEGGPVGWYVAGVAVGLVVVVACSRFPETRMLSRWVASRDERKRSVAG